MVFQNNHWQLNDNYNFFGITTCTLSTNSLCGILSTFLLAFPKSNKLKETIQNMKKKQFFTHQSDTTITKFVQRNGKEHD